MENDTNTSQNKKQLKHLFFNVLGITGVVLMIVLALVSIGGFCYFFLILIFMHISNDPQEFISLRHDLTICLLITLTSALLTACIVRLFKKTEDSPKIK